MSKLRYVGLDVHKDTIVIAVASLLRGGADRVWVVSAVEEGGDRRHGRRAVAGASAGVAGEDGSARCAAVGSLSAVGRSDRGVGSR